MHFLRWILLLADHEKLLKFLTNKDADVQTYLLTLNCKQKLNRYFHILNEDITKINKIYR